MKLVKTFNVQQNHQDEHAWSALVGVIREHYTALVGNLTLGDNIIGAFHTASITTSPTYSGGHFNPIVIPWTFGNKKPPQSVMVGQIINPSSQSPLLTAVTCHNWTYDSIRQVISVPYVAGLNNNCKYSITFEVK